MFEGLDGVLVIVNALTGETFKVETRLDEPYYFWLPDGKGFGYSSSENRDTITIVDSVSGTTSRYDVDERVWWNVRGPALATVNDPLAKAFRIFPSFYEQNSPYGISEDNQWGHMFDGSTGNVIVEEISSGRQVNVARPDNLYGYISPTWLRGSHYLAILNSTEPWDAPDPPPNWVLRIYDADLEQIVATYPWNLGWPVNSTPDGKSLLYGNSEICILNWQEEERRCIGNDRTVNNATSISEFGWSTDGNAISYVYKSAIGEGVCVKSLTHGETVCPTMVIPEVAGRKFWNPKWSPDNRFIIFYSMSSQSGGDNIEDLKIGIVSIDGSSYVYPVDVYADISTIDESLWRPNPKQP